MTAKQLKLRRKKINLTQTEFSKLFGYKSYHSICEMESGRRKISRLVSIVLSKIKERE